MIWLPALVGALIIGDSLGKSLIQGSDVIISPGSSAMKYFIAGARDKEGHWTEDVKMEHGEEDWHVEVDRATLEETLGKPKVKIEATFSAKPSSAHVKGEVEAKKHERLVFKLYPRSHRDWFGAQAECMDWGGHLAIPDTREKLTELTQMLQAHIEEIGKDTGAFLGFSDLHEEGTFVTVLGKPLFNSQDSTWSPSWFRSDQPDDDKSWTKYGEDCGSLKTNPSAGLNDVPCQFNLPFICEKTQGVEEAVDEEESYTPAAIGDEDEKDDVTLQLFSRSSLNWYEAKEACVKWGGHLAIPDSEEKVKEMTQMLNSPKKNPYKINAFLGFNDLKEKGKFVTIFDNPLFNSKNSWSPHWYDSTNEDKRKVETTPNGHCGSIEPDGGLHNIPCHYYARPYFCEKETQMAPLHIPPYQNLASLSADGQPQKKSHRPMMTIF